jgi:hypothetical protein
MLQESGDLLPRTVKGSVGEDVAATTPNPPPPPHIK